ncbi:MAG: hypothetical protein HY644_07400 [Acidobacteria bacterium]|nr:hypothetical protein [Acidobacteriota bacterium]
MNNKQRTFVSRQPLPIGIAVLFVFLGPMVGQQNRIFAQGGKATLLDLNSVTGLPGDRVTVAFKLDAPPGVNIGSVEGEISFPAKLVSFVGATRGPSSAAVKAQIKTEVKADPGDAEKKILKITVSSQTAQPPVKALPNGVMANLSFQIPQDAELGPVSLGLKARAWTNDVPSKPVQSIVDINGKIHITKEGIISCFFYMH